MLFLFANFNYCHQQHVSTIETIRPADLLTEYIAMRFRSDAGLYITNLLFSLLLKEFLDKLRLDRVSSMNLMSFFHSFILEIGPTVSVHVYYRFMSLVLCMNWI